MHAIPAQICSHRCLQRMSCFLLGCNEYWKRPKVSGSCFDAKLSTHLGPARHACPAHLRWRGGNGTGPMHIHSTVVHCTGFITRARGAVGAFRRSAAVGIERAPGSASARESRRRESRKAWFHSIQSTLGPSGAAGKKEKKKKNNVRRCRRAVRLRAAGVSVVEVAITISFSRITAARVPLPVVAVRVRI